MNIVTLLKRKHRHGMNDRDLLAMIYIGDGIRRQCDIARELSIEPQSVIKLTHRLRRFGWVDSGYEATRERNRFYFLTDDGKRTLRAILAEPKPRRQAPARFLGFFALSHANRQDS